MILEATIRARKLMHAVDVLGRTSAKAVLQICENGLQCTLSNDDNTVGTQVRIPERAFSSYLLHTDNCKIGVDLLGLRYAMECIGVYGDVIMSVEDDNRIGLFNDGRTWGVEPISLDDIKAPSEYPELPTTVMFELSGRRLKNIARSATHAGGLLEILSNQRVAVLSATSDTTHYIESVAVTEGVSVEAKSLACSYR